MLFSSKESGLICLSNNSLYLIVESIEATWFYIINDNKLLLGHKYGSLIH